MPSPLRIITLGLVLGAGLCAAQDKKPEKETTKVPDPVTRNASVTIDGEEIDYKVTAAKLVLKKDNGDPRASVFHVSYERTGVKKLKDRPVVFAFNGGPGSSAVWLHLGALGPRLVPTSEDGTKPLAPPHRVTPNPHSILDVADLVFIDPVSTGYSRPEKDAKASEFHGVQGDIESVGDFIRRWVTEHGRWGSPKFLLGESYGGIRAAGLADYLQSRYGMNLNGVVLLSSLLDFRTLRSAQGDDLMFSVYLPAYTAVAHHHNRIRGDRDQLVKQSRNFAFGEYASALLSGATLDDKTRQRLAKRLSEFTGISPSIFLETDLRLSSSRFRKELLRRDGLVLGRFDARVAWPAGSKSSDTARYDPSFSVVYGAFSTAMLDYLTNDLGWKEDSPYEILSGKVRPWDWGAENSYVNLTGRLVSAMRENPELEILVLCGYTDLATPPDGIEYSFRHMLPVPEARRKAIEFAYYEA
ncbi:MAG: peptidase S10, partial [Akkermansiaceae bacterium]|nr:peptidase S10 [Akkermansiaceae bacterium]